MQHITVSLILSGFIVLLLGACVAQPAPSAPVLSAPTETSLPLQPTTTPLVLASPTPNIGGELRVLCSPQEDWCKLITETFERQTGIKTSFIRMSQGEALEHLRTNKSAPDFDVWFGGPVDAWMVAGEEGLIEPYISSNAAEIADALKDPSGIWTGVYAGTLGFCSNPDVLAQLGVNIPDEWQDLLDPKLQGKISMGHPASSGTAFTIFWTQATLNNLDIEKTFDYFAKLNANILRYTKSGSASGKMAGEGEIAVSVIFAHACLKYKKEGYPNLVLSFPREGTGYEIGGVGIITGNANPQAARLWVDWTLLPKTQDLALEVNALQLPTNPYAFVSDDSVSLLQINLVNYDFAAAAAQKSVITKRFIEQIAPAPSE